MSFLYIINMRYFGLFGIFALSFRKFLITFLKGFGPGNSRLLALLYISARVATA